MTVEYLLAYPTPETDEDRAYLETIISGPLAPWIHQAGGRVKFFNPNKILRKQFQEAGAILAWNQGAIIGVPRKFRDKIIDVDPFMDISATDSLCRWVGCALNDSEDLNANWASSLKILRTIKENRPVVVIGSGPHTLEARHRLAAKNPFSLYLGTSLHDQNLCSALPPDVIIAADGPGQFGTSRTARVIRSKFGDALAKGSHLVVTEKLGPIAKHLFSDFESQVHIVPIGDQDDRLWKTNRSRPLGNVLTTLGLPVAAVLAKGSRKGAGEIETLGITLEADKQNAHWKHSAQSAMSKTALDMLIHEPGSVLPDHNYRENHLRRLGEMIKELREAGIIIANSAPANPFKNTSSPASSPRRPSFEQTILAFLVRSLDYAENGRHEGMAMSMGLSIFSLLALATGQISFATTAFGISIAALLAVAFLGLFLRLRMRRWTLMFERRRRQIAAAELAALTARLDQIEAKFDK